MRHNQFTREIFFEYIDKWNYNTREIMMIHLTEELNSRLAIYTYLCQHGKTLRSNKDFNKLINITHLDGSEFLLASCSWEEDETRIFIWTEHCGYFYFYKEDIEEMEIQEWRWKGFPEEGDERDEKFDWQIEEHKIIIFNMEVKPSGESNKAEKTGVSD